MIAQRPTWLALGLPLPLVLALTLAVSTQVGGCSAVMQHLSEHSPLGALAVGGVRAAGHQLPISEEEELAYGGAIAVMVVQKYGGVVEDEALLRYVALVGNAVASVSDRPKLRYHFAVLDSDQVNALAAPGGYIFITRGALALMKSEAELAGVLAHEVGHVTAKHALKIIQNLKSARAVTNAAASAWKDAAAFSAVADGFIADFLEKGLPKDTEFEADLIGTRLIAQVGYHPRGLRDFLKTMADAHKATPHSKFAATHPDTGRRLSLIDAELKQLGGLDGPRNAERFVAQTRPAAKPPTAAAPVSAERRP